MITTDQEPVAPGGDEDAYTSGAEDQPAKDAHDTPASQVVNSLMGISRFATDSSVSKAVLGVSKVAVGGPGLYAAIGVGADVSKFMAGSSATLEAIKGFSKFTASASVLEAVAGASKLAAGRSPVLKGATDFSKLVSGASGLRAALGVGALKFASVSPGLKMAEGVLGVSKLAVEHAGLRAAFGAATDISKFMAGGSATLEAIKTFSKFDAAMGAFGADSPAFKAALVVTQGHLAGSLQELVGMASNSGSRRLIDAASSLLREIEDEGGQDLFNVQPRGMISNALAYKIVIFAALLQLCFVLMMATPVAYKGIVDLLGPPLGIIGAAGFFHQKRNR